MQPKNIGILFIAGFGPIVADRAESRALYGDALGACRETPGKWRDAVK